MSRRSDGWQRLQCRDRLFRRGYRNNRDSPRCSFGSGIIGCWHQEIFSACRFGSSYFLRHATDGPDYALDVDRASARDQPSARQIYRRD